MKLTNKQQKFVEAYFGNATEAARIAGYAHPMQAGERVLRNVEIQKAIKDREKPERNARIASREDRQEFWTDTMLNPEQSMKDRLRASELLGKAGADFIDTTNHKHSFLGKDGKPMKLKARVTFVLPGDVKTVNK